MRVAEFKGCTGSMETAQTIVCSRWMSTLADAWCGRFMAEAALLDLTSPTPNIQSTRMSDLVVTRSGMFLVEQ